MARFTTDKAPPLRDAFNQYRRLLVLLRPYWGRLVRSMLLALVIGLIGMAPPYLAKLLIDEVYPSRDVTLMYVLVGGLLAVAVSVAAMEGIRNYFQYQISARLTDAASLMFFNHVQHLRARFFEEHQVGEVMSRFVDVRQALNTVSKAFGTVFVQSVYLFIVPPFLFLLEWRLALVALAFAPLTVGLTLLSGRVLRTYFKRVAEGYGEFRAYQVEVYSHIRTLKTFSVEHQVFDRARKQIDTALGYNLQGGMVGQGFDMANAILAAVSTAAFTWYGWTLILEQKITLGTFIAFVAYLAFFTQPLKEITLMFSELQQSAVGLGRMFEYLDEEVEQDPAQAYHALAPVEHRLRGKVELRNVAFGYQADAPVLHDMNLVLEAGELTAVVGQSGAGKSSLLRLICRLEEPVNGHVLFDGVSGDTISLPDVRRQVAVVWQDTSLLKGTIWDNLTMGVSNPSRVLVDDIVGLCRLDEVIAKLPRGYETPVAEWGASLSGGQRQRISLARALIRDTPILLLDEATSNIDQQTEGAILEDLFSYRAGRTTLYVTHRVSTASTADKICVMAAGRVVGVGTHESLLATCDAYVDMVNAGAHNPARLQTARTA
jgi:ABC-type bacteriocin/lantibiotic exporter with double-glycine peptidase domain